VSETLEPVVLELLLRKLYAEVRTDKGTRYSKAGFVGIRAGINRHLRNPPHNARFNILVDPEFKVANTTFKSVLKKMKHEGLDISRPHRPICVSDLLKLRESATLSPDDSPMSLVRKVWFDHTFSFLRRGNKN
jgi:hypothetical protein